MAKTLHNNSKRMTQSKNSSKRSINKTAEEIEFFSALDEGRANILADKLIVYVEENKDVRSFSRFLREQGVLSSRFFEAAKKFPRLGSATEYVSEIFAERKEVRAEERDPKFDSSTMHLYSYLFAKDKELDHERKKELKKISDQTQKGQLTAQAIEVLKQILEPLGE